MSWPLPVPEGRCVVRLADPARQLSPVHSLSHRVGCSAFHHYRHPVHTANPVKMVRKGRVDKHAERSGDASVSESEINQTTTIFLRT